MYEKLVSLLEKYDSLDLMSVAGGLQLFPENSERTIRIEAFAYITSCITTRSEAPTMSANKIREVLNNNEFLSSLSSQEDPAENMFTETITFIGGSYIVFPGIVENATHIIKNLNSAIFLCTKSDIDTEFKRKVQNMVGATLLISNAIATRVKLCRYIKPKSLKNQKIYVPNRAILNTYKAAVTFTVEELEKLLSDNSIPLESLNILAEDASSFKTHDYNLENLPIFLKPIIKAEGKYVVLLPGTLLATLRHNIICLAKKHELIEALSINYLEVGWQALCKYLDYLKIVPAKNIKLPALDKTIFVKHGVFINDSDKVTYVQLFSDDFSKYDEAKVFSQWECKTIVEYISSTQQSVEKHILFNNNNINDLTTLVIGQSVGRWCSLGFKEPSPPLYTKFLVLWLSDLEHISMIEGGKNLFLWQYTIAHNRIRKEMDRVLCTSCLDEYFYFKKSGYSYYISDKKRPTCIWFTPGGVGEIHTEVVNKIDFHGVPSYKENHVTEVANLHGDKNIPIYTTLHDMGKRVTLLLEGLPVLVWILGPVYEDDEEYKLHHMYSEFADLISYWLEQFTPSIKTYFELIKNRLPLLIINIKFENIADWNNKNFNESEISIDFDSTKLIKYKIDIEKKAIDIKIQPISRMAFFGNTNNGERYFMKELLYVFQNLIENLGYSISKNMSANEIQRIIDRHAPLGIKKKIFMLSTSITPFLDNTNLPDLLLVQKYNENLLLDDVGDYLTGTLKLKEGIINKEDRVKYLNDIAYHLFKKLEKYLLTMKNKELLEFLISSNERYTYERAFNSLIMPTRIACFGEYDKIINNMKEELQDLNKSNRAVRFLIEYISAIPCKGIRPPSYSSFYDIQSIASELINWAFSSDLVQYNISDYDLSILPSKRLGINRKDYGKKHDAFSNVMIQSEYDKSQRVFNKHWRLDKDVKKSELSNTINKAFKAEWNYTYDDIVKVVRELYEIGMKQPNPCKEILYEVLIIDIESKTDLRKETIEKIIDNFSLEERGNYWNVNKEGKPDPEVYPWRFNRTISFLRKPLIKMQTGETVYMLWGNRHLQYSVYYLLGLLFSGKLKANSLEMKNIISKFRNEQGNEFNMEIYHIFKKFNHLIVDKQKNQFGKLKIVDNGYDLGDIDVIAINTKSKRVLIIECKNLNIARTPVEIKYELFNLFQKDKSIMNKHLKRTGWVEKHINEVLDYYNVPIKAGWGVDSLIVMDEEMFSPHLYDSKIPVLTKKMLCDNFIVDWI
ncbi:hypothetical protein KKF70_01425 [bacterium]|nr:hypothetical protein [bacterium]